MTVGQRVFTRDYRWLDKIALLRTHAFYEDHGGLTFLLSPFIAVVRTLCAIRRRRGGNDVRAIPVGGGCRRGNMGNDARVGGYYLGNVPVIRDHMSSIVLFGVGIGVGSLVVSGVYRFFKSRAASK